MPPTDKLLLRRQDARALLGGISDEEFSKLVFDPVTSDDGVLPAIHLRYKVLGAVPRIVPAPEAHRLHRSLDVRVRPLGRAYFRRSDLIALTQSHTPPP